MIDTPTPQEQGVEAPTQEQPQETFFEYEYPEKDETGNFRKEVFKSPEELKAKWRESYMRQADYTRKTQDLAKLRAQLEKEQDGLQDQLKAFSERKGRYDKWDEVLGRRPDVQRQLERLAERRKTPDVAYERATGYADEKTAEIVKRLEQLEGRHKQAEEERELMGIFDVMEKKYPDFDQASVRELLEYLANGKTEPLVEMLHWAGKGRKTPAELEQRLLKGQEEKRKAGLMPSGGVAPHGTSPQPKTTAEVKEMLLNRLHEE